MLRREADTGVREVLGGRVLAPNDYVITLSVPDYQKVSADPDLTSATFAKHLEGYIHEQGWQTYGDVVVRFEQSSSLHTGQFRARGAVNPDSTTGDPAPHPRTLVQRRIRSIDERQPDATRRPGAGAARRRVLRRPVPPARRPRRRTRAASTRRRNRAAIRRHVRPTRRDRAATRTRAATPTRATRRRPTSSVRPPDTARPPVVATPTRATVRHPPDTAPHQASLDTAHRPATTADRLPRAGPTRAVTADPSPGRRTPTRVDTPIRADIRTRAGTAGRPMAARSTPRPIMGATARPEPDMPSPVTANPRAATTTVSPQPEAMATARVTTPPPAPPSRCSSTTAVAGPTNCVRGRTSSAAARTPSSGFPTPASRVATWRSAGTARSHCCRISTPPTARRSTTHRCRSGSSPTAM